MYQGNEAPTLPPPASGPRIEAAAIDAAVMCTREAMGTLSGMSRRWTFYCMYLDAYLEKFCQ